MHKYRKERRLRKGGIKEGGNEGREEGRNQGRREGRRNEPLSTHPPNRTRRTHAPAHSYTAHKIDLIVPLCPLLLILIIIKVVDEIFDMAKPERPDRVTCADLERSKTAHTVVSMLIDVNAFWLYENRENLIHYDS